MSVISHNPVHAVRCPFLTYDSISTVNICLVMGKVNLNLI